jgi:Flp pilus assembly protein TadG
MRSLSHKRLQVVAQLRDAAGRRQGYMKVRLIDGRLCAFRCGDEGQALVEFAVVLPMLLLIITGVFWIGFACFDYQQLCAAVNQGIVALAEGQNTGINPCTNAVTIVTTDTQGLIPSNNSLIVTTYENGAAITPALCPTTLASGTKISLQATYQYPLPIFGMSFANCCTLSTTQTLTTP